jgi:hypothetical protein
MTMGITQSEPATDALSQEPEPAAEAVVEPTTGQVMEPAAEAAVEPALAPVPAQPRPKPITWETERNAAVAALARVGATPREARVLASLAANAATTLREQGRRKADDPAVIDDQAAEKVLAAHRAAASPTWGGQ